MQRALFHAARAQGATAPDPLVGAVVVSDDGVVVGQGFRHERGGRHAEDIALDEAAGRARGATLFVTLEPRASTDGGPAARIKDAGVRQVVAAMLDPAPSATGRGVADLRAAGIAVTVGLEAAAARRLNAGYVMAHEANRPLVVVKAAVSRDGRIADAPGRRTQISGAAAARRTQLLRASADAVAVGVETVLVDDPLLTTRDVVRERQPARVVFDRHLRTPAAARLVSAPEHGRVIMVTSEAAATGTRARALEGSGSVVLEAASLADACRQLVRHDVHTLLVEGGGRLHRSFWEAGLVDRLHLIVAPHAIGAAGVLLFNGYPVPWAHMSGLHAETCGQDVWIEADVHWNR